MENFTLLTSEIHVQCLHPNVRWFYLNAALGSDQYSATDLTNDHKPERKGERERIESYGQTLNSITIVRW